VLRPLSSPVKAVKEMRWRAILLMATMGATLIVASGVALAETITCDSTPPCYGTPERDDIIGTPSAETVYMMGDNDRIFAGGGGDTVYGSTARSSPAR
jgi:hypothetical protein